MKYTTKSKRSQEVFFESQERLTDASCRRSNPFVRDTSSDYFRHSDVVPREADDHKGGNIGGSWEC